jgi:hypothetical protein
MRSLSPTSGWLRHFVYRKESLRTTWKFRLLIVGVLVLATSLTRVVWVPLIARSLICREELAPSDAILVENFDPSYLVFERAAAIQKAGLAKRALVHVERDPHDPTAEIVSRGVAKLMAREASLRNVEMIPIRPIEPISLNAAYEIRDYLIKERLTSVIVVTPGSRSRRSSLVYRAVLAPAGIEDHCVPVGGDRWMKSWHGIDETTQQLMKLMFYRFYVLPLARERPAPARERSALEHRRVSLGGVTVSSGASSCPMADDRTPARSLSGSRRGGRA